MTIKVLMAPHLDDIQGTSGVDRVIEMYFKYLPKYDIELVDKNATSYDLIAAHAGCRQDADVAHNHGMYWSADYKAADFELRTNANVIAGIRNAKQVTVPSHWVAEAFQRDMHFTPHIVHHGIEWEQWQHHEPNAGYVLWNKNRTGVDVCDPTVIRELAIAHPDVQFVTTFAPRDAPTNVAVTGKLDHPDMKRVIQHAGIYLANVKETFGIGILEAMASGVPILGYAYGGILEMVRHKVNGYLAIPGDVEDLIDGLAWCNKYRKQLSTHAREIAKWFTWDAACQRVAEVYEMAMRVEPPTCAIIIPSFQYGHKLADAIHSAMEQDYPQLTDIIVVDDGTQDEGVTRTVVTDLAKEDHRVQYLYQDNAGVAHARNNGIANTDTKYICCLDADDEIEPNFLSALIPALEADTSLGIAYSGILATRGNLSSPSAWPPATFNYDEQLRGKNHNQIPTCCVYRREMWNRLGGYRQRYAPANTGCGAEDAEFWLRAGANGWNAKCVTCDPLFIYSIGTGNTAKHIYKEPDWLAWHPWTKDGQHPFASLATPAHISHRVRQYDQPEVSVIIPCGPGHAHLLVDALDSLEAQTYRKWEAIVINDSGEDIDLTPYPYVRLVTTPGRKGAGYARNRGIEIARALTFICLDADDYLQPTFIERVMAAHSADPDRWVYTDMYLWKSSGIMEEYHTEDWDAETLWRKGIAPVTCLYRWSWWNEVGGYNEECGREDWDFHMKLAHAGHCGIRLPELLFTYRHDTGQRREQDNRRSESKRLKERYTKEDIVMPCRSCGKKRSEVSVPTPEGWERQKEEWPLIEYTGNSTSEITFTGKDKRRKYRFGNNPYHLRKHVHPDDVAHLLGISYFKLVRDEPKPESAAPLVADPKPTPMPLPTPVQRVPKAQPVQSSPQPAPTRIDIETLFANVKPINEEPEVLAKRPARKWSNAAGANDNLELPDEEFGHNVEGLTEDGYGDPYEPLEGDFELFNASDVIAGTVTSIRAMDLTSHQWEAVRRAEITQMESPRKTVLAHCDAQIKKLTQEE